MPSLVDGEMPVVASHSEFGLVWKTGSEIRVTNQDVNSFVMPAIFDSLVHTRGLTPHKAWRVAYIVPFIIIVTVAVGMAITCDDTPTGKWSERHLVVDQVLTGSVIDGTPVDVQSGAKGSKHPSPTTSGRPSADLEKNGLRSKQIPSDSEAQVDTGTSLNEVKGEIIIAPTLKEVFTVMVSKESLALAGPYACSFGKFLPSALQPPKQNKQQINNFSNYHRQRTRHQFYPQLVLP